MNSKLATKTAMTSSANSTSYLVDLAIANSLKTYKYENLDEESALNLAMANSLETVISDSHNPKSKKMHHSPDQFAMLSPLTDASSPMPKKNARLAEYDPSEDLIKSILMDDESSSKSDSTIYSTKTERSSKSVVASTQRTSTPPPIRIISLNHLKNKSLLDSITIRPNKTDIFYQANARQVESTIANCERNSKITDINIVNRTNWVKQQTDIYMIRYGVTTIKIYKINRLILVQIILICNRIQTTEEGLRCLNNLKTQVVLLYDEVIDAINNMGRDINREYYYNQACNYGTTIHSNVDLGINFCVEELTFCGTLGSI